MATETFRPTSPIGEGLSRHERETIVRISADESEWSVYTSCPTMARRLEKLAKAHGVETSIQQGGLTLNLPKRAVSFRNPRVVTDKMLAHLAAINPSIAENTHS